MIQKQSIHDFYLASSLIAIGIKLQSHQKQNGNTVFDFNDDEQINSAIKSYYSMNGTVEPMSYANAIKAHKSILHSSIYTNTNSNSKVNNYVQQFKVNK